MQEKDEGRLLWVDTAKGIGILLVLLGHSPRPIMCEQYIGIRFIYYFIYTFHMPFFFFLSGVVYGYDIEKQRKKLCKDFVKKRIYSLLLPWFTFSVLLYMAVWSGCELLELKKRFDGTGIFPMNIWQYLLQCVHGMNPYSTHLWYIYTLFFVQIIVFVTNKIYCVIVRRDSQHILFIRVIFIASVFLFIFSSDQNISILRQINSYLVYYILGILFIQVRRKRQVAISVWSLSGPILCGISALVLNMGFLENIINKRVIYYTTAFIGIPITVMLLCAFAQKIEQKSKGLLWLGKNSFEIYLLHQPLGCAILGGMLVLILPQNLVCYLCIMIICMIFSVILPVIITELCYQIKIGKIFLRLLHLKRMKKVH